jgi:hypothetical protein
MMNGSTAPHDRSNEGVKKAQTQQDLGFKACNPTLALQR